MRPNLAIVGPLIVVILSGCGSGPVADGPGGASTSTAFDVEISPLVGTTRGYNWTFGTRYESGLSCLVITVAPSILPPSGAGPDVDEFAEHELWNPPACTPMLSAKVSDFDPLFVPYLYQGHRFARPIAAGLAAAGLSNLEAVGIYGSTGKVIPDQAGRFVLFPQEPLALFRFSIGRTIFSCSVVDVSGLAPMPSS